MGECRECHRGLLTAEWAGSVNVSGQAVVYWGIGAVDLPDSGHLPELRISKFITALLALA
jgi:hypothetical protein